VRESTRSGVGVWEDKQEGAKVSGDKQEVRQEYEGVSRKRGKSVSGSAGNGAGM